MSNTESRAVKSTVVERRMGVFKSLSDVPSRYRLECYSARFDGQDTLGEWAAENVAKEWRATEVDLLTSRWVGHMDCLGRHHALATPKDVDGFIAGLLDEMTIERVHRPYWVELERFYEWLAWHTDYPHCYNPVRMAAAQHPAAGRVWEYKVTNVRNQSNHYE